jgi:hypothetical protein
MTAFGAAHGKRRRHFARRLAVLTSLATVALGTTALQSVATADTSTSAVTNVSVSPGSTDAGASTTYTVTFTTTAAGATRVDLTAPADTVFPTADGHYSVSDGNGSYAVASVSATHGNGSATDNAVSVVLAGGSSLPDSDTITVAVSAVTNAGPGGHTLTVATDADPTPVTSDQYTLTAALVTVGSEYAGTQRYDAVSWHDGHLDALLDNDASGGYPNESLEQIPTDGAGSASTISGLNTHGVRGYGGVAEDPDGSFYATFGNDSTGAGGVDHIAADGSSVQALFSDSTDGSWTGGPVTMSADASTLYFGARSNGDDASEVFSMPLHPTGSPTVLSGNLSCNGADTVSYTAIPVADACFYSTGQSGFAGGMSLAGNDLYVLDILGAVQKIDLGVGTLVTIAGGGGSAPADGGTATDANLTFTSGLVADRLGDVFIGAANGAKLFEISTDGTMHLLAGGGTEVAGPGVAPTDAELDITGLTVDTAGNLYIASNYNDGTATHAQLLELAGVAAADTAPSAPRSLTATAGDQSVTVSFQTPSDDGGSPVTGYTVTAHPHGAADSTGDVVVPATTSPVTVTGLVNGTQYDVSVTATNAIGTGAAATTSVTPAAPDAVLTADVTSGTAPFHVHLDASGSTAPAGATFTFYCGDSDSATGAASSTSSADCTYYRESPDAGWNAYVSMHDPATGKDYQDTVVIKVDPAAGTVDDSAAFNDSNQDADLIVADDGSMHSADTSNCGQTVGDDTTCATVDGATVLLTAAPGTFAAGTHVQVYHADTAALQNEVGSALTAQGGFAVTWTPRVTLTQALSVIVQTGAGTATPNLRTLRPADQVSPFDQTGSFWSGIYNGFVAGTIKIVQTIGSALHSVGTAVSNWWQGAAASLSHPNGQDTNSVLFCPSGVTPLGGKLYCNGPGYTVLEGVSTDKIASLEAGGYVIAAGGGNVIAAGGGNVIAAGGGNVIAAGGGNFTVTGASVIAAGGGNVIAAGGGNVIAAGGGNVIAAGGGNVIAAGGGNLTFGLTDDPGVGFVTPQDSTPPAVTATPDPAVPGGGVYPYGSSVTVHLAATGSGGASVQNVNYSTSGAESTAYTMVEGDTAEVVIDQPGATTITYSAQDSELNDADPQTIEIDIAAPAPPGAPTGVTATDVDFGSAQVSWTAPADHGQAPITGYTVEVIDQGYYTNPSDHDAPRFVTFNSTDPTQTIPDLTKGHEYEFLVSASNGSDGDYSSPNPPDDVAVTAHVPDAPTGLTATPGDGRVSLSWTAPADSGLPLNNYFVYRSTTSGGTYALISPCPSACPSGTTYTDTTAGNGTRYYYVVSAENPIGEGAQSAQAAATPESSGGGSSTPSASRQDQTITFTAPSGLRYGGAPTALGGNASSGLAVSYSSSTPAVCTVGLDQLTIVGAGTCSLTASQPGDGDYAAAPDVSVSVAVARAALRVTASNAVLRNGAATPAVRPRYAGLVNGDVAPATPPTCAADLHTMRTACFGAKDANYAISYADGLLRFEQKIWLVAPSHLSYGDGTTRLRATANSHRHVALSAAPSGVCEIAGRQLSVVGAGTCVVTAHVRGSAHWAPATTEASIVVRRADLRITAADASMHRGGSLPDVVPTYHGFVHGDGPSSLRRRPACAADPRHRYTHCWGARADNYRIHYVRGTLTVLE